MRSTCGQHPCHYYRQGICRRCGKRSRGRELGAGSLRSARHRAKQSYLEALDNFTNFCRDRELPVKPSLVEAMQSFMERNG